jgi:hypothetical protein
MGVGDPIITAADDGELLEVDIGTGTVVKLYGSRDEELDTGGDLWGASVGLARWLLQNPESVRGKTVLELGSGLGLLGVAAAKAGASRVVLTDQPAQMKLLNKNIVLNEDEIKSAGCVAVECAPLMWGDDDALRDLLSGLDYTVDVVLAADVGYDWNLHSPLMSSLQSLCFPATMLDAEVATAVSQPEIQGATSVLIAEEKRWSDIYGWFRDALRETFDQDHSVATSTGSTIFEADVVSGSVAADADAEERLSERPTQSRVVETAIAPPSEQSEIILLSVSLK